MRRLIIYVLTTSPLSLLVALGGGCGTGDAPPPPKPFVAPKPVKRTPLDAKGMDGVLHGKIVFDGEPPVRPYLTRIDDHPDKAGCKMGGAAETTSQTWIVNPGTKAVANIVVWVEPPKDKYFSLRDKDKNHPGELVVIDQPHCAFVPHVVALFPSYFDGEKLVKTGQELQIKNSATFPHEVQWNSTRENDRISVNIPPNGGHKEFVLNPEKSCLPIGCGIHNWMHGIIWIFEHPYYAVTNEDGTFRIDNLPTGVELTFKAWHETKNNPFDQRPVTLKAGENPPIELTIKK